MEIKHKTPTELAIGEIQHIRGSDNKLGHQVIKALGDYWETTGSMDLDHSLYLSHYWQQAIDDNPEAKLIPHNPLDNESGEFAGDGSSWERMEAIVKMSMSNHDEFVGHFEDMVKEQDFLELLDKKSLVISTNHQSYLNPAEIGYGIAVAMKNVYDEDVRPNTHITIGPRITTTEFNGLYLPDVTTQFCNWQLVVPDTPRGRIPGDVSLSARINGTAMKQLKGKLRREPGTILIVAPSGGRDADDGTYRDIPTPTSIKLVSPSIFTAAMPIAIGDRGLLENMKKFEQTDVSVAFGPVVDDVETKYVDEEKGLSLVDEVLYDTLVPEVERARQQSSRPAA